MKICAIADAHLNQNDHLGKLINTEEFGRINSRLYDKVLTLNFSVETAIKEECELFVVAGDTFDKSNPSREVRKIFFDTIKPLFDNNIHVLFIIGNHELSQTGKHPLIDIEGIDKNCFYIIDDFRTFDFCGFNIALAPWGTSEAKIREAKSDILYGHLPVVGEYMNNNVKCDKGISREALKGYSLGYLNRVRLGHFHKRNDLYIGSLARDSFHEKNYKNGFEILDLLSSSIPNPYFIEVKDRNLIEIKIENEIPDLDKIDITKEDIVKFKIKGTRHFVESIKLLPLFDISAHKVIIDKPEITDVVSTTKKEESVSVEEYIDEYCEEKNQKDMIGFGKELWKEHGS